MLHGILNLYKTAHIQFGEPSWRQNQGPKEIPSSHKKILIFLKNNPRCINYETSCYLNFSMKQKECYDKPWKTLETL